MLTVDVQEVMPVQAARAGDPTAWDTLFRRYQLPLYVYVFELVRHEQSALDIIQEAFINAVRYLPSLRDDQRFGAWLFGIAHQKCLQLWRRSSSRDAFFADRAPEDWDEVPDSVESPSDELVRKEDAQVLQRAVAALPRPQRSVVLLHFLEDFPLEEVARITDSPLGTVKSRLHYAKTALRQALNQELS